MATRVAIPPFVMAHMSLQEYGLWTSAFILVAYLGVSTMGLSNVYIRYVAKYEAEGNHRSANELLTTGLFLTVPLCLALFGALVYFWPALQDWLKIPSHLAGDAKEAVLLVVLIFLSSIALSAFGDVLNGIQRIDVAQKIWVTGYILETVLIFVLVSAGRGVRGMAEAFFIRTVCTIGLSIFFSYRLVSWLHISPRLVSRRALRDLLSFGSVVQIQCFFDVVLSSIERVLALAFAGFEMAGLLEIAKKMPSSIAAIPLAFAGAFLPAASHLQATSNGESDSNVVQDLYLSGARHMNLAAAYFCGFLALLALPILDVWLGKRLPGTEILLPLFAIGMQFHLLTGPGTSIMKGIGRPLEEFHYCLPNALLLLITVPLARTVFGGFTAVSIGWAVVAATVVSSCYFLLRCHRKLGITPNVYLQQVFLPGCLPYVLAVPFAILIGSQGLLHINRLTGAALVVVAGVFYTLLFAAVCYAMLLEEQHRLQIRQIVQKIASSRWVLILSKSTQPST